MCRDSGGVSSIEELLTETSSASNTKLDGLNTSLNKNFQELKCSTALSSPYAFDSLLDYSFLNTSSRIDLEWEDYVYTGSSSSSSFPDLDSSSISWKTFVNVQGYCILHAFNSDNYYSSSSSGGFFQLYLRITCNEKVFVYGLLNDAWANGYHSRLEIEAGASSDQGLLPSSGTIFNDSWFNEDNPGSTDVSLVVSRKMPIICNGLKIEYAAYRRTQSSYTSYSFLETSYQLV